MHNQDILHKEERVGKLRVNVYNEDLGYMVEDFDAE